MLKVSEKVRLIAYLARLDVRGVTLSHLVGRRHRAGEVFGQVGEGATGFEEILWLQRIV